MHDNELRQLQVGDIVTFTYRGDGKQRVLYIERIFKTKDGNIRVNGTRTCNFDSAKYRTYNPELMEVV